MNGTSALIPAAGRGARFGSPENKVFAPLLGRPLLGWTLEAFARCDVIDSIVLVGSEGDLPRLREIGDVYGGGKVIAVVLGGSDRQASVRAGLAALPEGTEYVVIHDGARPCVTPGTLTEAVQASRMFGATTAAIPVVDTLVQSGGDDSLEGEDVPRAGLMAIQTPQAFALPLLREAHETARRDGFTGTDDAGLVRRMRGATHHFPGSPENLKVTRPEDLALAEAILRGRMAPPAPNNGGARGENAPVALSGSSVPSVSPIIGGGGGIPYFPPFAVGHGYDVHAFAEGRRLFLGGVEFPDAPRGLLGHSDADVILHAVCDALLGAAGLGDIGKLFPPSDMRHKDRPSLEFLEEVRARLDEEGWRVGNVDITVLAETPKIGPRADDIRSRIAVTLGMDAGRVGVKATTNEGMGFVGRSEGIAAHATALLFR